MHNNQVKPLPVPVIGIGRGFEHRTKNPEVVVRFFLKVLKKSRIFRFSGHCILKKYDGGYEDEKEQDGKRHTRSGSRFLGKVKCYPGVVLGSNPARFAKKGLLPKIKSYQ